MNILQKYLTIKTHNKNLPEKGEATASPSLVIATALRRKLTTVQLKVIQIFWKLCENAY